ncbi:hypothetical protein XELAEV_18030496mg [Xenopus laevis]|uniref:Retinoic acid receptor responder protein 2 n=1 Tax=Xenopus laevis TaxID=8355 RepID=A0A974HES3_XENLA|nr:hypothetical protein XELAEV_18030496mg [Xenopus laevis]
MKISRTWSLLVALGFIVAVSGQIPVSELSDLQKKAMSLVTEHFYEKYNPTYNFTTTVLEASQEVSTTQAIGSSNLKDHLLFCSSHFMESSKNVKVPGCLLIFLGLHIGIFVRLHIEKQQSNCRRNDPTAVKCRPRRKKVRTTVLCDKQFSCLSCFLFEYYSHNVVSKFIHCAQNPGLTSDWEIQCRRVNEKAPEQLPGGYSVMLRSSSELRKLCMTSSFPGYEHVIHPEISAELHIIMKTMTQSWYFQAGQTRIQSLSPQ